jgi:uncharacterized OB-fold protein
MKNVEIAVKGKIMTITVDLSKSQGPSKTGKTVIIATTEGGPSIAANGNGEIRVNLNVYKYPDKK